MERVAIPIWQGRVSPVLDTAERLWICDVDSTHHSTPRLVELTPADMRRRTEFLRNLGIATVLCGALSRPLHSLLLGAGISVWPWLTGAVEEVLAAYSEGRLDMDRYLLPGCRRRQRGRSMGTRGRRVRKSRNRESK